MTGYQTAADGFDFGASWTQLAAVAPPLPNPPPLPGESPYTAAQIQANSGLQAYFAWMTDPEIAATAAYTNERGEPTVQLWACSPVLGYLYTCQSTDPAPPGNWTAWELVALPEQNTTVFGVPATLPYSVQDVTVAELADGSCQIWVLIQGLTMGSQGPLATLLTAPLDGNGSVDPATWETVPWPPSPDGGDWMIGLGG